MIKDMLKIWNHHNETNSRIQPILYTTFMLFTRTINNINYNHIIGECESTEASTIYLKTRACKHNLFVTTAKILKNFEKF